MHSSWKVIAWLIAAAFVSANSGSAETFIGSTGGGGGPFESRCPSGKLLRGLELRAGNLVDAVRPVCASIGADGKIGDDSPVDPWRGGPGGSPVSLMCPERRPVIVGTAVQRDGQGPRYYVHHLHIFCGDAAGVSRPATDDLPDAKFDGKPWEDTSNGVNFRVAYDPSTIVCPKGQVGTGIHGRHGKWLDNFGLICARSGPAPTARAAVPVHRLYHIDHSALPNRSVCQNAKAARATSGLPANVRASLNHKCLASVPFGPNPCGQAKRAEGHSDPSRFETLMNACLDSVQP